MTSSYIFHFRLLNVSEVSVYNSSLPVRVTAGSLEHLYLTTPKVFLKGDHLNILMNITII